MRSIRASVCVLLLVVAGCSAIRASPASIPAMASKPPIAAFSPFDVSLLKKARWAPGREGFDAALPGYHLVGDIASIRLTPAKEMSGPAGGRAVDELVFRIQTSPGMPPNVENLTIIAGGLSLSTALSNGADGKGTIEIRRLSEGRRSASEMVPQSRYIGLKVVGGAVELRLLPAAVALLKDGGEIRWIDWHRG